MPAAPWTAEQAARARVLAATPGAVVPFANGMGARVRGRGGEYVTLVREHGWSCTCAWGVMVPAHWRDVRCCYHVPATLIRLATPAPAPVVGAVLETRCAACAEDVRVRVVERVDRSQWLGPRVDPDGALVVEVRPGCVTVNLPCCGYIRDLKHFRGWGVEPAGDARRGAIATGGPERPGLPAVPTSSAAPGATPPSPGAAGYPCPRCGGPGGVLVRSPWEDPDEVEPCPACQRDQERRQEEHLRRQDAARRQRPRAPRNAVTRRRAM